ncbi:phosphotransferase [Amycolatopsis aidingensis]|uniref:phosphotransferase n=1 Tax=Amycolatopsis aidingensis TaxID=2842453 RepID=UPI001C0D89A8|nr:phosphotransferase [Amycolatopsis aidingensis]
MEQPPAEVGEPALRPALRRFGIDADVVRYAAVGFGDHHWTVTGAGGQRWFATVADLAHKDHDGRGAAAALDGLRRAMDTAARLGERLSFVVPPLPAEDGGPVVALNDRYALSVFPFVQGEPGWFGQQLSPVERERVLDLLAELHRQPPPGDIPVVGLDSPGRAMLADAVAGRCGEWAGGPFAGAAADLLARHAPALRARLREFDLLAERVRQGGAARVVTHGEPHPGNLLAAAGGYRLIDWDTVALAVPERDLAVVTTDAALLERYARATGRAPDPDALALYSLRWLLTDAAEFTAWFRGPHARTSDTERAWRWFTETLERLERPAR